jgi:hypothetical protein
LRIWGFLADQLSANAFSEFIKIVDQEQNSSALSEWFIQNGYFKSAKEAALAFMSEAFEELENEFDTSNSKTKIIPHLRELGMKIARSYE